MSSIPSITIDTGVKELLVNDDPTRVIRFNPKDINFAERFFRLVDELDAKWVDYQNKYSELLSDDVESKPSIPANVEKQIELVKTFCEELRSQIDLVFGEGTSQTAFQDSLNPEMFVQFIEGITPYIQGERLNVVKKYLPPEKIKSNAKPRSRSKKK